MSFRSAFGSPEGAAGAFGVASDDCKIGAGRLVWLGAALFPITQRTEQDLIAGGKFLLGQAEGGAMS